jgi:ADP-heptose:LPS heptosyltransferase
VAVTPSRANGARRHVLVLRALGLGDLLTAIPALRALRRALAAHEVVLAAPAALGPLARHAGAADWVWPASELGPLRWAEPGPDVAVNLHGRGPLSHQVLEAARPARLVAFAHPDVPASLGGPAWRPGEHEVGRWCRLLTESGIPTDPDDLEVAVPSGQSPSAAVGATVIHPGAAAASRRWPSDRYASVAAHAARHGPVVITGSRDERPLAEAVASAAGLGADGVLAGTTDVMGLAAVVARARRVVCGDTGVGHLATALGTPSVVLFGPTSPSEWGPPADRPWHRALWAGVPGDPHGAAPDPGLLALSVADVVAALDDLPDRAWVATGARG